MQLYRCHVAHPAALVRAGSVICKFRNCRVLLVCFALFAEHLELTAAGAVAPVWAGARSVPSCALVELRVVVILPFRSHLVISSLVLSPA
jgi:hypothetical protein